MNDEKFSDGIILILCVVIAIVGTLFYFEDNGFIFGPISGIFVILIGLLHFMQGE